MQEQAKLQQIPVKVYRTLDRLMAAAPMPGLQPEDILVEVKEGGHLILHRLSKPLCITQSVRNCQVYLNLALAINLT